MCKWELRAFPCKAQPSTKMNLWQVGGWFILVECTVPNLSTKLITPYIFDVSLSSVGGQGTVALQVDVGTVPFHALRSTVPRCTILVECTVPLHLLAKPSTVPFGT